MLLKACNNATHVREFAEFGVESEHSFVFQNVKHVILECVVLPRYRLQFALRALVRHARVLPFDSMVSVNFRFYSTISNFFCFYFFFPPLLFCFFETFQQTKQETTKDIFLPSV